MWVCPHCGAPQAETARCWVCRRSSTACSTCRHFRTSLAADVGFCAKDRWRAPLTGRELRACWEEGGRARAAAAPDVGEPRPVATVRGDGGPLDRPNPMRLRGFVPVEELEATLPASVVDHPDRAARTRRAEPPRPLVARVDRPGLIDDWEKRVSLFGEADA